MMNAFLSFVSWAKHFYKFLRHSRLPRVLRELVNLLSRPLSIIFDSLSSLGGIPKDWKKVAWSSTKAKSLTCATSGWPLFQFLGKSRMTSSWKPFPGTWRKWLGTASMNLSRINHTWPSWLLFYNESLVRWTRGKQWVLPTWNLSRIFTLSTYPGLDTWI